MGSTRQLRLKNPRKLIVACGVIVLAVVVVVLLRPNAPSHEGRSLTYWVRQYDENFRVGRGDPALRQQAGEAIQAMGTNAIPHLITRMRAEQSPAKTKLSRWVPERWRRPLGLSPGLLRSEGVHGIAALGTNAAPALKDLMDIAANHPDTGGRYKATWVIGQLRSAADPAVPFLLTCLTNEYHDIRTDAAYGLSYIRTQPDMVVPAVTAYLKDAVASNNDGDLLAALQVLFAYGEPAPDAAIAVESLLDHFSPSVRQSAERTLPRIMPHDFELPH